MAQLKPVSTKQFIVTISGLGNTTWTSKQGGKVSREPVEYPDGQTGLMQTIPGMHTIEPLTLSKPFDPSADKAVVAWITQQVSNPTPFNVACQPVKADLTGSVVEGSSQILYSNCVLLDYSFPDADRAGSGVAMFTIVVKPNAVPTYQ